MIRYLALNARLKDVLVYKKIIILSDTNNMILIPKEYWNKQVEILLLSLNDIAKE